jgi:hypothetical protein
VKDSGVRRALSDESSAARGDDLHIRRYSRAVNEQRLRSKLVSFTTVTMIGAL